MASAKNIQNDNRKAGDLGEHSHSLTDPIHSSQNLMSCEEQLLGAFDREGEGLVQDLHDGLTQHLLALRYLSNVLHGKLRQRELPEVATAEKLVVAAEQAVADLKEIRYGFSEAASDPDGLIE